MDSLSHGGYFAEFTCRAIEFEIATYEA